MSTPNPKIKAIVFDCFGVLATDGWLPFKSRYFKRDNSLLSKATELNKKVDAGLESYDTFIGEVSKMAGIRVSQTVKEIEANVPNEELFRYISEELRPNYKLGILSNAGSNWLDEIFTSEQIQIFDAVALSYEIGAIKPSPITYETIASRLGLSTSECVFIDDQERYCTGAREAGMQAIQYITTQKLRQGLSLILNEK